MYRRAQEPETFQSTLPRRERRQLYAHALTAVPFQSTLPRRERPVNTNSIPINTRFQSTLPRRERRRTASASAAARLFQSTLPRRERQSGLQPVRALPYFNPRSREGSDSNSISAAVHPLISIHAPAKGATYFSIMALCAYGLFQSTLPRRERLGSIVHSKMRKYFNPRSREGSDINDMYQYQQ